MLGPFFANFDLAALAIWGFWLFFAGLIFYIQRENMREGYPLEDEAGNETLNQGPFPIPDDKTFKLPHGQGSLTVPSGQRPDRADLAMDRNVPGGYPLEPTGNPMLDGVGPASWANREDVPEMDGHGHPKIVPMSSVEGFFISAGGDPVGKPVMAGDRKMVGTIKDIWIDAPEQLIRYLEVELDAAHGSGTRLIPLTLARVQSKQVKVKSIYAQHFNDVPKIAHAAQVTKLEEEKICAYYAGGHLYADPSRAAPQI